MKILFRLGLVGACGLLGCARIGAAAESATAIAASSDLLVYIGTYTGAKSKGIYFTRLDLASGRVPPAELAVETPSPSFLALHPSSKFLYAANEVRTFNGKTSGSISAFAINRENGRLTLLNQQASEGAGPCHLVVDKSGQNLLVANYGGGSVAVLPIQPDGQLSQASAVVQHQGSSVDPQRQKEPHAHSINLDPANRFAFAADLGLDKMLIYRFDPAKGTLLSNEPASAALKPGAGPRHFAFHPSGRFAYVINEMHCTVTAFGYDPGRGELKDLQTLSTLPEGESVKASYSTAEVQSHPSGKFLYGSNRGHDSIAIFDIDSVKGTLKLVETVPTQGKTPRNFGLDPSGRWLLAANQGSDNIVVFRIDPGSGRLAPVSVLANIGSPVCIKFVVPK